MDVLKCCTKTGDVPFELLRSLKRRDLFCLFAEVFVLASQTCPEEVAAAA